MARRQVNNISRLTQEQRFRVCQLLCDGWTYDEINAEMHEMGVELVLHGTSFKAYQESDEYKKYSERLINFREETYTKNMVATVNYQGLTQSQNLIEINLMDTLNRLLPGIEDAKTAKAISSAMKDLADLRKNSAVARLEAKIAEFQAQHAEEVAGYQAKIAELSAKLTEITSKTGTRGISEDALRRIEEGAGLL